MRSLLPACIFVAASLIFDCSAPLHAEQVIVDTDFSKVSSDGSLDTTEKAMDDAQLPLRSPTNAFVVAPSTIVAGKEALGDLNAPYALLKMEASEENPEVAAGVNLQWSLRDLALEAGRYKLTYQIMALAPGVGGGRFAVTLVDDAGKGLDCHPTAWPLQVFFTKDKLLAQHNAPGLSYGETQLFAVEITFDLDKKIWSASVDGMPMVTDLPFPQTYLDAQNLRISTLGISAGGGTGEPSGSSYALAHVKLVQLD